MKLLTKAEYMALTSLASPEVTCVDEGPVWEMDLALAVQGRACIKHLEDGDECWITPAGREALRLWPLLLERGLVQP